MSTELKNRLLPLLGVAAAIAVAGWWFTSRDNGDGPVPPAEVGPASDSRGAATHPSLRPATASDAPRVEIDMLGTKLDASRLFELGFAGGLAIDKETRATLGTLLMAMPDEPSAQDIEKLEWTLRNGLPKDDAEKAINMFHGYRAYLGDMKTQAPQLGIPDSPEAAAAYFDQVAQVQRRHFDDATAKALFGQEMLEARVVMQAAFIHQNTALDADARKAQLDQLRAQLPEDRRHLLAGAEASRP